MHRLRPLTAELRERTLVIVKPDGVQRGLVGRILGRFEDRGMKIVGVKILNAPRSLSEKHYEDHKEKPFFSRACRFLSAGPVVPIVLEGRNVVSTVRLMCGGKTEPTECAPGTIRGDYGTHWRRNIIHSSDSVENGRKEIALWFREEELCDWDSVLANWMNELPNAPDSFEEEGESYHPGHLEGRQDKD